MEWSKTGGTGLRYALLEPLLEELARDGRIRIKDVKKNLRLNF